MYFYFADLPDNSEIGCERADVSIECRAKCAHVARSSDTEMPAGSDIRRAIPVVTPLPS